MEATLEVSSKYSLDCAHGRESKEKSNSTDESAPNIGLDQARPPSLQLGPNIAKGIKIAHDEEIESRPSFFDTFKAKLVLHTFGDSGTEQVDSDTTLETFLLPENEVVPPKTQSRRVGGMCCGPWTRRALDRIETSKLGQPPGEQSIRTHGTLIRYGANAPLPPDPTKCTAQGTGLVQGMRGQENFFLVYLRAKNGTAVFIDRPVVVYTHVYRCLYPSLYACLCTFLYRPADLRVVVERNGATVTEGNQQ